MKNKLDLPKMIVFNKNCTYLIKGIAILAMVLHHLVGLYYNKFDLNWYSQNSENYISLIFIFLSTAGKVCVPLLTILSGFGLSKSFEIYKAKNSHSFFDIRFVLSHLFQFYSIYWVMFFLNTLIRLFDFSNITQLYGCGWNGFLKYIFDFMGLSKLVFGSGGFGDWYVSAILILYILFPVLYKLGKRSGIFLIVISAIPWFLVPIINSLGIATDSALFCLLSFSTGIIFAQTDFFEKLKKIVDLKYKLISMLIVVSTFVLRLVFSFYVDYFFAISIINFGVFVLSDVKYLNKVLIVLGKNSANIWLSHGTIIYFVGLFLSLKLWWKYLVVLLTALLLSMLIEYVKKKTGYLILVKKIRASIEKKRFMCRLV